MQPPVKSCPELNKYDLCIALTLGLAALTLYIRTLIPGLALGDSAEFQTLAYTLGMTHPTGYPVYLLLGKLFSLFPFGDTAYCVNLLSAVCASTAASLVYLSSRQLGTSRIAAFAGGASFALAGVLWTQAVIAEIYAPAAMMLAAILFCLFAWRRYASSWWVVLAGLLGGLSLGVHNTIILAAPAVLLYLVIRARRWQDWSGALLGVLLGVILWFSAFLFIDSQSTPTSYYDSVARIHLSGWGLVESDFNSPIKRLSFMLTGSQFRQSMFTQPFSTMAKTTADYGRVLKTDFSLAMRILASIGCIMAFIPFKREQEARWQEGLLLLTGYMVTLVFALNYRIVDIHVFYIPTYIYLSIACALGISGTVRLLARFSTRVGIKSQMGQKTFQVIISFLLVTAVLLPKASTVARAWEDRFYRHPLRLGSQRLDSAALKRRALRTTNILEDDAILFSGWIELYTYFYVTHVEGNRTGMRFHEIRPAGTGHGLSDTMQAYIRHNIHQHPIYVSHALPELGRLYKLTPVGNHLFRLEPP